MPYCPECGEEVGAADRFCQACGTALGQTGTGESRRTGRGDPDRGIDYGRDRRPGESGGHQSSRTTPGQPGQPGRNRAQGQPGRQLGGGQSGRQPSGGQPGRHDHQQPTPARGGQQFRTGNQGLLSFSVGYPANGGAGGLILGSLALVFFWLVVPFLLLAGYFVRMAAAAAAGRPEPPGFGEWTGMVRDGAVLVVGALPIWLTYGVLTFVAADTSGVLSLVFLLLGSYLFPAIFVNYAVERRWGALYEVSTLTDLLTTSDYAVGYLAYVFLINGVGSFVVVLLLAATGVTLVGILLWPLIFLYWYAIGVALWGKVYRQVMGPATIPDPPTAPPQRHPRQQPPPRQQQRH